MMNGIFFLQPKSLLIEHVLESESSRGNIIEQQVKYTTIKLIKSSKKN